MKTVFVIEDYSCVVFSIHATREGAEKAFKELTKNKTQERIDEIMVLERKLED
jgi:hypothetical protein